MLDRGNCNVCAWCHQLSCPDHVIDGVKICGKTLPWEKPKECDEEFCGNYVCLFGDCEAARQHVGPFGDLEDADGIPLAARCDGCGRRACWSCATYDDRDGGGGGGLQRLLDAAMRWSFQAPHHSGDGGDGGGGGGGVGDGYDDSLSQGAQDEAELERAHARV